MDIRLGKMVDCDKNITVANTRDHSKRVLSAFE